MKIVNLIIFMFLLITSVELKPKQPKLNQQKQTNTSKDKRKLFDLGGGFEDAFADAGKEMEGGFTEAAGNVNEVGSDFENLAGDVEEGAQDVHDGAVTAGSDIEGGFNDGVNEVEQGYQDASNPNWDFDGEEGHHDIDEHHEGGHHEGGHHEGGHHEDEHGSSWGDKFYDMKDQAFGEGGMFDFFGHGGIDDISLQHDSHIIPDHSFHKGGKAYHHMSGDSYGIHFDADTEEEHLHNFKKISGDLSNYEQEYIACIEEISDFNYSEDEIEACTGPNFIKLLLDIKYETYKIIARADAKVREYFVHYCYIPAGEDSGFSKACDLLEKDLLDLLWSCLDFLEILTINSEKYLSEYTKIELDHFHEITNGLAGFSKEYFDLLDEIDAHKEVTLLRVKNHIDDRTKLIINNAKEDPENAPEPRIVKHYIQIEEKVSDPNFVVTATLPHYPVEGKPEEPPSTDFAAMEEEGHEEPLYEEEHEHHEEGHEHHEEGHENHEEEYDLYEGEEPIERKMRDGRRRLSFSERDNRYRFLNSGGNYKGLNSSHGSHRVNMRKNADSMKAKYRKWLGSAGRIKGGGKGTYQNIHTKFGKKKARR